MSAGLPKGKMPLVKVRDQSTPVTYNDPTLTAKVAASFKKAIGEENVIRFIEKVIEKIKVSLLIEFSF